MAQDRLNSLAVAVARTDMLDVVTVYRTLVLYTDVMSLTYSNQTVNDGVAHSRIGTLDQPVAS